MEFNLNSARSILARTPATLNSWLRDLPDSWALPNEGAETWSAFDVVGHLVHGERTDWIPRARIILARESSATFEPFDRFAQLKSSEVESLNDRLDQFSSLRARNLATLDEMHLTSQHLALEGHHPELGTVTLGQLLSTWVVHDLGHIAQIARVMAKCYRAEVGAWAPYLPILRDDRG